MTYRRDQSIYDVPIKMSTAHPSGAPDHTHYVFYVSLPLRTSRQSSAVISRMHTRVIVSLLSSPHTLRRSCVLGLVWRLCLFYHRSLSVGGCAFKTSPASIRLFIFLKRSDLFSLMKQNLQVIIVTPSSSALPVISQV